MRELVILAAFATCVSCAPERELTLHEKLAKRLAAEGVAGVLVSAVESNTSGAPVLCGQLSRKDFLIFTADEKLIRHIKPATPEWERYCGKGGPFYFYGPAAVP